MRDKRLSAKIRGISPQFLVDDLQSAIAYYRDKLGFEVAFVYEDFYAEVRRGGASIHLKCAPKTLADRDHRKRNEHLDAYLDVENVSGLYEELTSRGAVIIQTLEQRPWHCRDFYVEDVDGYILCFSESTAQS